MARSPAPPPFCWPAVLALILLLPACAPTLAPLYRDYEAAPQALASAAEAGPEAAPPDLTARYDALRAALTDAGWTLIDSPAASVVATAPRTLNHWGLYSVEVSLEAAPVGPDHVRLFIHPVRRFFTGSRSKIPFLRRGLRQAIVPELNAAFEAHGLYVIGSNLERDRDAGSQAN